MSKFKRVILYLVTFGAIAALMWFAMPAHSAENNEKAAQATQQMNQVYAEHLATGLCKSEYSKGFMTGSLKPEDAKKLNAHTSGACGCLYRKMADDASSADIIDYVMYIYGSGDTTAKPNSKANAYIKSPKFAAVGKVYSDKNVRKKCGFIK